jgi:hypothetical protein
VSGAATLAPLLLERRSLVLDGIERVFIWHPCRDQH